MFVDWKFVLAIVWQNVYIYTHSMEEGNCDHISKTSSIGTGSEARSASVNPSSDSAWKCCG